MSPEESANSCDCMPYLPRLKVKGFTKGIKEEIINFEEAKNFPYTDYFVFLEGHRINSYEEFVQLATQSCYKDREFLEIFVSNLGAIVGG